MRTDKGIGAEDKVLDVLLAVRLRDDLLRSKSLEILLDACRARLRRLYSVSEGSDNFILYKS